MNILLISHDFTVTGAPNSLLRQAIYFREAGHNVDIWSLGDGGLKPRYIEAGFNPIIIDNDYMAIKQQYKNAHKKYDFILCNTTVTYKAVDILQRYKTPLVWFIRETKLVNEGISENPDFKRVFTNFYNIYTVSDYAANISKQYNKNVRIIRNAIADKFQDFKKTDKKIVFGYIGSLIPIKGVDLLVEAFNKLVKKHKNLKLTIAGPYNNEYGLKVKDMACPQTEFLGEIQKEEKQKFFDGIDILVVPSIDDPCPLTVIEGTMLGKPVITTDTTGSNFMVKPGYNGFIVKTGDANSLYKSMEKILTKDLDKMKQNSRKMYLKYGTTERERKQVLEMLNDNIKNLPVVKNKLPKQPIVLPLWVCRLICLFVFDKQKRRDFRHKHAVYKNQGLKI